MNREPDRDPRAMAGGRLYGQLTAQPGGPFLHPDQPEMAPPGQEIGPWRQGKPHTVVLHGEEESPLFAQGLSML
jgi:hypothetical protein